MWRPSLRRRWARAQLPMLHSNGGHAAHEEAVSARLKVGEQAPEVNLPDLAGKKVGLEEFKGNEVMLLFWSPSCGHCQDMLSELKEWEADPPEGAPKLLVVSDETVEANKAQGLRSPVVMDYNYALGDTYGAPGTPSAVLVDAEGRVASEVVVGASAVLELARAGKPRTQGRWWRARSGRSPA
jgi:peroxiredoxin